LLRLVYIKSEYITVCLRVILSLKNAFTRLPHRKLYYQPSLNYKNASSMGLIVSSGESSRWKTTINHSGRRGYGVSYTQVTETHKGTQSLSPSLHPRQHHYLHGKHRSMFAANTAVCNPSKHNTSKTVAVATSKMCSF
jgi:hypothetical protein